MSSGKQRQLLPSIADKETRFQQNRLDKASSLEGRLRKHRALNKAHKAVVKELYSGKEALSAKPSDPPAIIVAPSPQNDENNNDDSDDDQDFSNAEDDANLLKYTGRRCSPSTDLTSLAAEGSVTLGAPQTTRRCSSARERRPSVALCETNLIYSNWETKFQSSDDMNLSVCNFLKKPDGNGRRSSGDRRSSLSPNRAASPLEMLNRSTEALNTLKDSLEPGDSRPSSGSRRSSLYQLTKSETDIWKHCQRLQRRRSVSLNDVSVEELKKCRYLRIPSRYT